MNVEQARFNMIEQQIRPWDVLDAQVLQLLADIKREAFVPPAHQALAFADLEIPLKPGPQTIAQGQVMLAPRVEARMLQDVAPQASDKVLEIGTGSGFMAALLARCTREVLSVELDAELADTARHNLKRAGIHNVEVRQLDAASADLSAHGPFDVIVLSGSVSALPQSITGLLAPGGRLIAIVGNDPVMRATVVRRDSAGAGLSTTQPWDTIAPRLLGFGEPEQFRF